MVGANRSTTHRYVITLVALGYLEQAANRKYRLTLGVTRLGLGAMSGMSVQIHAMPLLYELRDHTNLTVGLAVLDGAAARYLDHASSVRAGRRRLDVVVAGSCLPVHAAALGKILLAYLPGVPRRALIQELTLAKTGPKTITSKVGLRRELQKIRDDGLAVEDEELKRGRIAIAAPVRDVSRETVAAIGMAADRSVIGLEGLVRGLSPHLLATADRISARLGYRRESDPDGSFGERYSLAFGGA
jgi:IclR family pca regulon transcriptional regulator